MLIKCPECELKISSKAKVYTERNIEWLKEEMKKIKGRV